MIDFNRLESGLANMRQEWNTAQPFQLVIIDEFARDDMLSAMMSELPLPGAANLSKSRDYVFAKNKYEKSGFASFGQISKALYDDLISERFQRWLSALCGRDIWVDREFHGGGLHQGGAGSFLDMHVDFNVHPLHSEWLRDLNILLYLNKDWKEEYGGQLKLRNRKNDECLSVDPVFNRCVVMETRDYTLHGYDPIRFPGGEYRRSIACYAYSRVEPGVKGRSTIWFPETGGMIKRVTGRIWPTLVRWKGRFFGSGTARNR